MERDPVKALDQYFRGEIDGPELARICGGWDKIGDHRHMRDVAGNRFILEVQADIQKVDADNLKVRLVALANLIEAELTVERT